MDREKDWEGGVMTDVLYNSETADLLVELEGLARSSMEKLEAINLELKVIKKFLKTIPIGKFQVEEEGFIISWNGKDILLSKPQYNAKPMIQWDMGTRLSCAEMIPLLLHAAKAEL